MKRAIDSFRGEAPRLTPRALPDNAAQEAVNCRLLTGDLTAWRQFSDVLTLSRTGPVQSIFLLHDVWLSSDSDLNYARGAIPGDTTYRTYITGMDVPRFTNYSLATSSGSSTYPVITRPLGVPGPSDIPSIVLGIDPTPSTFSVDVLDDGSSLASSWVISPFGTGSGLYSEAAQDAGVGNPAPSYRLSYDEVHNPGQAPYAYRNFGVAASQILQASTDFKFGGPTDIMQACMIVGASVSGAGVLVEYQQGSGGDGKGVLLIGTSSSWDLYGSAEAARSVRVTLSPGVWYTMTVQAIINSDSTTTVTAALYQGSRQITTTVATVNVTRGDYCGIVNAIGDDALPSAYITWYDNYHVQASGASSYVPATLATSYVYTYVNDIGEESGPSFPSAVVVRPDGVSATVTTATSLPSGIDSSYGIVTKRIYRAATGNTGTAYLFVAEIALATADYVDVLTDAQLGEVLQSTDWTLPPDDLRGILALPNGVMAGFSKNQLCLSAQNNPHAWPVANRLTTDTDIIGIGNVDTTVVIGTKSFVYIASGTDPAAYSMSKFEIPQAASSKNSFAYLANIGVVFSGPDGLMAVQGVGQVKNLTESVFTREQWQALGPSSMRAVSYNDIYFLFWEFGSNRGCYAIDMKANGFGIVTMAFHACAAYVDPIEDKMYLVLDENNEPDDPSLAHGPSSQPTVNGHTIALFEGNPTTLMNYRYRSKLWLLERPAWFQIAQVRAGDYDNLLFRVYGDGAQLDEFLIVGEAEFTLGEADSYTELEFEFVGTSEVRSTQAAEDVTELT